MRVAAAIRKVFDDSGGTHGSPRVGTELRKSGSQVSDNTIAQLMALDGLTDGLGGAGTDHGGDVGASTARHLS